jgi:hypothetical protein
MVASRSLDEIKKYSYMTLSRRGDMPWQSVLFNERIKPTAQALPPFYLLFVNFRRLPRGVGGGDCRPGKAFLHVQKCRGVASLTPSGFCFLFRPKGLLIMRCVFTRGGCFGVLMERDMHQNESASRFLRLVYDGQINLVSCTLMDFSR